LTRRAALKLGVLAVLGWLLAGIARRWGRGGRGPYYERFVGFVAGRERRLRAHFAYLNLDMKGVAAYFTDHDRYFGPIRPAARWPSSVYTRYLLSTDFFPQGADEAKLVRYRTLYAPPMTACRNPFFTFTPVPDDGSRNGGPDTT
jgi:hypothetical protein